jgi:hypothetical protein
VRGTARPRPGPGRSCASPATTRLPRRSRLVADVLAGPGWSHAKTEPGRELRAPEPTSTGQCLSDCTLGKSGAVMAQPGMTCRARTLGKPCSLILLPLMSLEAPPGQHATGPAPRSCIHRQGTRVRDGFLRSTQPLPSQSPAGNHMHAGFRSERLGSSPAATLNGLFGSRRFPSVRRAPDVCRGKP